MKNILIVGANGIIGSYVYKSLKNKFSLSAISKSLVDGDENFHQIDLTEIKSILKFTKKCKRWPFYA